MTEKRARGLVAGAWGLAFLFSLAIPLVLHLLGRIKDETLKDAVLQISSAYAPYLGAIVGYFAASTSTQKALKRHLPFVVACWGALLWNALVIGILLKAALVAAPIKPALKLLTEVTPPLAWLVAPVISYYFGKSHE